jgi:hypothetical protein
MPCMNWIALSACAGIFMTSIAHAELRFDAITTFTYDDNVSNSLEAQDRKGDSSISARLSGGVYETLGSNTSVGLSLVAEPVSYVRYSGLSNIALGANARLRYKFGLGDAPTATFVAQALHRDYHYDYRDGWQYDGTASLGKQLNARWSVRTSVRYDRYTADQTQATILPGISTAAYDTWGWSFGAQSAYWLTDSDLLSASYTWRNGTATAVTPPDREVLEYSSAVARDTVFSSTSPLIAYRISAKTDIWALAWSHALSAHAAVNLAYSYLRSRTESDLGSYYSNLFMLSFTYSY